MSETKELQLEKKELTKKLSFNSELIFFKNELLGDLKQIENKFVKKLGEQKDDYQNQLMEIQNKIDALTGKIFNISNTISQNKFDEEKIESLHKFHTKMEETINLHELRMNSIAMDLVNAINKYDRLIDKNLFYPGIIGADNARFTTLHNFIDYVLKNIEQLNNFKEQAIGFDFERYKKKLNSMMEGLRKQSDQILTHGRLFTIQYMENLEKKVKSDFDLYDQKLFDIKIKNAEQYSDFDKIIKEYEKTATITNLQIKEFLKQYNDMNKKFDLIIEFLKGVKSQQGNHMNFNEFIGYKNSQEFYKKKPNVESYLKKYIGGLLGMDELSKLTRKHKYGEENNNYNNNNNTNNNVNNSNSNTNYIKKFIRKKTTNIVTPNKPNINNPVFLNNNVVNPKTSLSKSISQGFLVANKINNNLKENLKNMNNSNEKIIKDEKIKLSSSIKRNNILNINKKSIEKVSNSKEKNYKEKSQENILDEITETITNNNSINEENDNKNKNEINKIENSKIDNKEKEKEIKIKIKNTPKKKEKKEAEQKNSKRSPSNKSNKEEEKKDKLMNNIKLEKKINDNVDEQKNNNIINNININKIPDTKKENSNNNNYNFNIIVEHNENEEKEYYVESDLDTQIKLNNQKIVNLMDKENNTNTIDFENNSNNLDILKNELLFELQDKNMPNTNKNNKTFSEKFYINDNSKNNLHKLLTGDKNALRYFKIINNGQEIDLTNMTIKDKNKNNYDNSNLNNRNLPYFDNIANSKNLDDSKFYNTINSGFYINGGKNKNNSNYKSKKIDISRSVSTNYKINRNKPKLKIVNLPEIPNSVNKETGYQRTDDYFYEAENQRNPIGKFNNYYDLYGKSVGPFKTNIRNMSPNNIKLRAYDGFT